MVYGVSKGLEMLREYFPYFKNSNVVYLDNAATTQKLESAVNSEMEYYFEYCSNVHRSGFSDANKATKNYEKARENIKRYLNASDKKEIIFTKGVSESINFIASSYAKKFDTVIISSLEHHSNIVPWHMQGRTLHNGLEVVGYTEDLEFDMEGFEELLKKHPNSFVSITHISNAFGVIHDIKAISLLAHKYNAVILIDGAQSLAHTKIDLKDIGCDFFAFSAHKTFSSTGVGGIYINEKHLENIEPYQSGGATISEVSFENSKLLSSPFKFEAGTGNIAGVIGFGELIEWLEKEDIKKIENYEKELYRYLDDRLKEIDDIEFYNSIENSIGSRSFNIKGIHHDDIGVLLDKQNIAIRVGHHCAQPIMTKLGIKGTIRVSIAFYNTKEDIDRLVVALKKSLEILRG
jgi:cysteine desulfurase/selenocysteine lyase